MSLILLDFIPLTLLKTYINLYHLITNLGKNKLVIFVYRNPKMSWSAMVLNHCAHRGQIKVAKSERAVSDLRFLLSNMC